jgi:VCBS repeat-containing protein
VLKERPRFGRHPRWIIGLAGAFIVAGTASVVAVAASSPVVEPATARPAPSGSPAFPGTFASAANAQPDCHSGSFSYPAIEDTALAGAIVCTDPDADALTYALTAAPVHGDVAIEANGHFTYAPSPNYSGTDSFQFQAQDPSGAFDTDTATVTVAPVNDPPVANPDGAAMAEDGGSVTTPNVLANDTPGGGADEVGQTLSISGFTQPAHGRVVNNGDGTFAYTPNANFNGTDTFTYDVTDDGATGGSPDPKSSTGTVTITVSAVNDAPVANDDSYSTERNAALSVPAPGALANDTDVEGDALSAVKVANPAHGTVTMNGDGSFTYTPASGFVGDDSFTYKANDGAADSNVATVSITVQNTAPVATNDSYSLSEDNVLTVGTAAGPLANDSDANGDPLAALKVTDPAHGSATLNPDGSFFYTPSPNYNGPDSFTYQANDGVADSNVATVTVAVRPVNDAPTASDGAASTNEDTPSTIDLRALVGDTETAPANLTYTIVRGPSHGSLNATGLPNGSFSYTPSPNYSGADSFAYSVTDRGDPDGCGGGPPDCTAALTNEVKTLAITVNPVNDKPLAAAGAAATAEDTAFGFDVRPLVSDLETAKASLTYNLELGAAHGSVVNNHDGTFRYTPDANYNGPDSFAYSVTDRGDPDNCSGGPPSCAAPLTSEPQKVSITVAPVNDAPTASDGTANANEDTPSTIDLRALAGDTETAPGNLVYMIVSGPRNGSLTPAMPNGTFTYTPTVIPNTGDSFTYSVTDRGDPDNCSGGPPSCDGALQTGVKTVTLTIPNYVLNVGRTGGGTGVVTSSPGGINCGTDCSEPYGAGKLVTLTAAPASNSRLAGWSGACAGASTACVVTMSSAKEVIADFAKKTYHLRIAKTDDGSGAVTSSPDGIDCGATCDAVFDEGATVTLTATASSNSSFEGWGGSCSGTAATCTVTMSATADVIAHFKAKKAPPPGSPVAGQSFVLSRVSGTVYYRKPGSTTDVKLTDPVKLPPGTIVDAEEGVVNVKAAEGNGKIDSANFWAGAFRLDQYVYRPGRFLKATGAAKKALVTQLTLVAGSFSNCAASRSQAAGSEATKLLRKLWGYGKGKFRMKGRYSSTTVQRAKWYVEDDCAGTRTTAARNVVEVRDFVKKKTVLVRAGHSYFAASAKPKKKR